LGYSYVKNCYFLILILALALATPAHANTFLFNWTEAPGSLGTSHTYTFNGMSITAMVYNDNGTQTGNALYGKNSGGNENGIGTTLDNSGQHEIVYADYVQLDFSNVLKNYNITSASLQINSDTNGESYAIYGTNTAGGVLTKPTPGTTGTVTSTFASSTPLKTGNTESTFSILSYLQNYKILAVTETLQPSSLTCTSQPNILIGTLTIEATLKSTVPEPGTFGWIACSLAGLSIFSRKLRRR